MLKAIRKMEVSWAKVAQGNFSLGSYEDINGQSRPCYFLTKNLELTEDCFKYVHGQDGRRKLVSYLVWTKKGREFVLDFINEKLRE